MSTSYIGTPMSLVFPVPGQQIGPDYAINLNSSLTIIGNHTHAPGSGVQVTPSGLNINADLTFNNSYSPINMQTSRFFSLGSTLASSSPNIGCLYVVSGDLYYNDTASHIIRITQGGAVSGSAGTITGLPSGSAGAAYSAGTFTFTQSTGIAANIDAGTLIVRYPGSYPTPAGNYIAIEAPAALASGYAITLPALPAQTNVLTLGTTGILASITYDAVGVAMTSTGANAIGVSMTATGANAVGVSMTATGANAVAASRTRATGAATESIGGVAISSSCAGFSTTTYSAFVDVTNLSVTLTTSGRPIFVGLIADGTGNVGYLQIVDTLGYFQILNGSSVICLQGLLVYGGGSVQVPVAALSYVDIQAAGTYTYKVQIKTTIDLFGSPSVAILNAKLIAYEL